MIISIIYLFHFILFSLLSLFFVILFHSLLLKFKYLYIYSIQFIQKFTKQMYTICKKPQSFQNIICIMIYLKYKTNLYLNYSLFLFNRYLIIHSQLSLSILSLLSSYHFSFSFSTYFFFYHHKSIVK